MTVVASRVLARKAQPMIQAQRRTFLDWMVNYPDRVSFLGRKQRPLHHPAEYFFLVGQFALRA